MVCRLVNTVVTGILEEHSASIISTTVLDPDDADTMLL
jgi:hypothetical protein